MKLAKLSASMKAARERKQARIAERQQQLADMNAASLVAAQSGSA